MSVEGRGRAAGGWAGMWGVPFNDAVMEALHLRGGLHPKDAAAVRLQSCRLYSQA